MTSHRQPPERGTHSLIYRCLARALPGAQPEKHPFPDGAGAPLPSPSFTRLLSSHNSSGSLLNPARLRPQAPFNNEETEAQRKDPLK